MHGIRRGDLMKERGYTETILHWFTTPEELRALATKMEIQQLAAKPGDKTIVKTIDIMLLDNQMVTLQVHYDQE